MWTGFFLHFFFCVFEIGNLLALKSDFISLSDFRLRENPGSKSQNTGSKRSRGAKRSPISKKVKKQGKKRCPSRFQILGRGDVWSKNTGKTGKKSGLEIRRGSVLTPVARLQADKTPWIFSRTLRFYYVAISSGSLLPGSADGGFFSKVKRLNRRQHRNG